MFMVQEDYIKKIVEQMKLALEKIGYKLIYEVKPERDPQSIWLRFVFPSGSTLGTVVRLDEDMQENIRKLIIDFSYSVLQRHFDWSYTINEKSRIYVIIPERQSKVVIQLGIENLTIHVETPSFVSPCQEIPTEDVFDVLIDLFELIKLATETI